uniref:Bestrophin homolog n=1 Tax=Ascaris lumbricoides TaxID=6252 RepID=A0A0M3IAK7_ASCLU
MTATAELRPRSASIGTPRCTRPQRQRTIVEQHPDMASTSECSSSSTSLDGPSPYAVRQEERYWYCTPATQASFFSHPLISPKLGRRSLNTSPIRLQRGFSDPIVRRKRSLSSLIDRLSGGSFDQLSSDFLNLPPIPEVAPTSAREARGDPTNSVEDETDYDDSSECSDFNGST